MAHLRRWFALFLGSLLFGGILHLAGCGRATTPSLPQRLTVGIVSYDAGAQSAEKYQRFQTYLADQLKTLVELEPAFNELRAIEQIQANNWSLVFAPSGLAAIAIAEAQYLPIFALADTPNQRSLLVVRDDSNYQTLGNLANHSIALGEPGSATGYYLPLYDLYGLTLESIRFAPTPKTVLEWVQDGTVAAGATSEENFQQYRNQLTDPALRVLHKSRIIPPGAVLLSPQIERNQQQLIEAAMKAAPANIVSDAGYVANAPVPDFVQLIQLVEKVRPLEERVKLTPVVLTHESQEAVAE